MLKTFIEKLQVFVPQTKRNKDDELELHQTDRNYIRAKLIDNLAEYLDTKLKEDELDIEVHRIEKGISLTFQNDELGAISCIVVPTMQQLDFDPITEEEEYHIKLANKAAKKKPKKNGEEPEPEERL